MNVEHQNFHENRGLISQNPFCFKRTQQGFLTNGEFRHHHLMWFIQSMWYVQCWHLYFLIIITKDNMTVFLNDVIISVNVSRIFCRFDITAVRHSFHYFTYCVHTYHFLLHTSMLESNHLIILIISMESDLLLIHAKIRGNRTEQPRTRIR